MQSLLTPHNIGLGMGWIIDHSPSILTAFLACGAILQSHRNGKKLDEVKENTNGALNTLASTNAKLVEKVEPKNA